MRKDYTPTDIREAELVLAGMIQNAKARGLKACKGHAFIDAAGSQVCVWNSEVSEYGPDETTVACCAVGAYWIDPRGLPDRPDGVSAGNDGTFDEHDNVLGVSVGAAFQDAMAEEGE